MTNNQFTVGVVGNPNCGKTTLFNALTGSKQQVGNWPGVTVEKKTGHYAFRDSKIELVDLPGTYSLESADDSVSLDEKVARDFVAQHEAELIINIIDANNIERNLYLTSQLLEMRTPMVVALNMMDAVTKRGIKIDHALMSRLLGCPVVPITAATGQGIQQLKEAVDNALSRPSHPEVIIDYHPAIESAINSLIPQLAAQAAATQSDLRWLSLRLLENDTLAIKMAGQDVYKRAQQLQCEVEQQADEEIDILAADARYSFVNQLTQQCVCKLQEVSRSTSDKIDRWVLNRVLGIPIFLLVMYAMFMFTINIGSAFIDFFDIAVGAIVVDGLAAMLQSWGWPDWLIVLLANGAGGGIQVVATFIPIVGFLFVFLSILEDSGYMSRAAFVVDRFMSMIGLPGKSFVPMIIGFGCNVPAIMATRTLDNRRDRILTNLMNPFMSCGARLPVYALFATVFFPVGGQNLVFGLYLLGIVAAVLTGLLMRHTLFRGEVSAFIMELPTYHLPTVRGVAMKTWDRLKSFIFNAGKVIVPMVLVLNFLNALGLDGRFGQENSNHSVLSEIGRTLTPVFTPMGVKEDNWPATVGIFTGVLAKEAVVGTLDALYSQMETPTQAADEEQKLLLGDRLLEAWQTIPDNLRALTENWLDPLGLDIGDVADTEAAAEEQAVSTSTFNAMRARFDGQAGAFAYLLFILLYAPCVAATAAIYRETSAGWAVFVVCWTTGLAYITATLFYQLMTFSRHPQMALTWCVTSAVLFGAVFVILRYYGKQQPMTVNINDSI